MAGMGAGSFGMSVASDGSDALPWLLSATCNWAVDSGWLLKVGDSGWSVSFVWWSLLSSDGIWYGSGNVTLAGGPMVGGWPYVVSGTC